jgi:histone deacetylase 1/2
MVQFHSEDYVKFLSRITPDNTATLIPQLQKCMFRSILFRARSRLSAIIFAVNMGDYTDCPVFDGLYDYCKLYTGGSIGTSSATHYVCWSFLFFTLFGIPSDGAIKLNHGQCDIAINWSGGLHHAKKV